MRVDLHIHTTASDGTDTPQQVVTKAASLGLKAIAITDHDEISGVSLAVELGRELGIEIIPGVEINTEYEHREVHILGYFIDCHCPALLSELKRIQNARKDRVAKIVHKLHHLGIFIDLHRVFELSESGSIGRPHIGMAMQEKGYVDSVQEAFQRYIGFGCPAFVPRYHLHPVEAVGIIQQAKGVAVFAHPGLVNKDHLIPQLVEAGLQGLEVYYPEHTEEQIKKYKRLARDYNLVITGGSDYHGPGCGYRVELGEIYVPYQVVEDLRQRQYQIKKSNN